MLRLLLFTFVACSWAATTPITTSLQTETSGVSASPGPAYAAINLLPEGPLTLAPNNFDADGAECSSRQVLRATYDGFALPRAPQQLSILLSATGLSCQGTNGQQGVLLGLEGVDVALDCAKRALLLTSTESLGTLVYKLPADVALPGDLTLLLTRDLAAPSLSLCINGQPAARDRTSSSSLLSSLLTRVSLFSSLKTNPSQLSSGLVIGARSDAQRSASGVISHLWLAGTVLPCGAAAGSASTLRDLQALAAANAAPVVTGLTQSPAGEVFVGDAVQFTASASDSNKDDLRLAFTFYGLLPQGGCKTAQCGDWQVEQAGAGGVGNVTVTVSYPRPGRYIVRLQVSDSRGSIVTRDHDILVRKQGDTARRAPCCRHSPYVVAQQLGRPIHETQFRPAALERLASSGLGWGAEYMRGADLEAERLFDYGMLAPPVAATPLQALSCEDTRLAGSGSPVIYGATDAARGETRGHAKRLVIVPEAFPWAGASQVACQRHWSGWQDSSPYRVVSRSGQSCSVGCTKEATEWLIQNTGMMQQYSEALIQASYGQLSLSPEVTVLPQVTVPFETEGTDEFTYYERPALQAMSNAGATDYWMYMILAPLANHRVPPFRAWSGGMPAKNAVLTQCYATAYYAVHETGHRLGFRHANIYQMEQATAAPSDPLGPGNLTSNGYSNFLDGMAGPKGDFGLYNRIMAGWVPGSARSMLSAEDLAQHGEHRLVLWPFDRSESRGNLLSLTIRRSADEILVVGFRSASHWQDVRVASNGAAGPLAPEEMRGNVAGLSVELLRRDPVNQTWSQAGLLDFNVLHGDWPHALPAAPGAFPRLGHFALLKEAHSWYDPATQMLLSLEYLGPCQGHAAGALYNHSALGFYGFRGEFSGSEFPKRADYTGFSSLQCAHVTVTTRAAPPSGKLRFTVERAQPASGTPSSSAAPGIVLPSRSTSGGSGSGQGSSTAAAAASRRLLQAPSSSAMASRCEPAVTLRLNGVALRFADQDPTVTLRFADVADARSVASVVWKDALNRTLAAGPGLSAATVTLFPLADPIAETAALPALGCSGGSCPDPATFHCHVLARDGRHTHVTLVLKPTPSGGLEMALKYKYYELSALSFEQETKILSSPLVSQPPIIERDTDDNGAQEGKSAAGFPVVVIAGAGAGAAVVLMAIAVVVCVCVRRRRARRAAAAAAAQQQFKASASAAAAAGAPKESRAAAGEREGVIGMTVVVA